MHYWAAAGHGREMPMKNESDLMTDPVRQRRDAAAQWLLTFQNEEMNPERAASWLEWTRADPKNLEAFDRAEALASGLNALAAEQKAALLRKFVPEPVLTARPKKARRRYVACSLAASVALTGIGVALYFGSHPAPFNATYLTHKAEKRIFELPDGTRVELGASTQLDIDFTLGERRIDLRDGEAYFDVKHNARRPFNVHAGGLHITDIGTRFDVRKSGTHVMVTVAEGIVDVRRQATAISPSVPGHARDAGRSKVVRLNAGEQIRTDAAADVLSVAKIAKVDVRAAASWRSGRLDFQDEPLAIVIANVNRYAPREVVIVDPEVASMRFTGTVFQDRVEDWLAATSQLFALRAEQSADGRVLLYADK
jgi:transmembrane sensor